MAAILISYLPMILVVLLFVNVQGMMLLAPPFVILSLYIYFRTLLAPFHLILEGCNPLEAVLRSFRATRGQVSKIFLIVLFYMFAVLFVEAGFVMRSTEGIFNSVVFLCGVTMTMLMVALQQIAFFRLYLTTFDGDQGEKQEQIDEPER